MESHLNVVVSDRQDVILLAVSGELDMLSSRQLEDTIKTVITGKSPLVVLDLAGLEFVDVSGVRALGQARARARSIGARLSLVNVGGGVRRVLTLTSAAELLSAIDD